MRKLNKLLEKINQIDLRLFIIATIAVYYVLYWGSFQNFINDIDHCNLAFCDFVAFYYPAGKAILSHSPIPDGFYYSNFAAILLSPFALFQEKTAIILWGMLQMIISAVFYIMIVKQLSKDKLSAYIFTFLFFTSSPLLNNFKWGQFSIFITSGILGAFFLYENGKRNLSAFLLGVMVAIKFYPIIFLLPFIIKRDWKFVILCIVMVVSCLVLIPLPITGFTPINLTHLASGEQVVQVLQSEAIHYNVNTQYLPSAIARYFNLPTYSTIYTLLVVGSYLVVVYILFLLFRISKSKIPRSLIWSCGLLFTTIPLWIPSAWPHYFVYLPFLQIMVFRELKPQMDNIKRGLFILWVFSVVLSNILIEQAVHNWYKYIGLGVLLWSNMAILLLFSIILWRKLNPKITKTDMGSQIAEP
ncbi:glycosyltransferase family 87 protein [Chloroflexota bacterium]